MKETEDFIVSECDLSAENCLKTGNKMLVGNGCFGYRGTLEEDGADRCVALNIANLYDRSGGGWRENVNAPNPLLTVVKIGARALDGRAKGTAGGGLELDMSQGLLRRESRFKASDGEHTVFSERFLHFTRTNVLCHKYVFSAGAAGKTELFRGIDARVWNLSGEHFVAVEFSCEGGVVVARTATVESRIPLVVYLKIKPDFICETAFVQREGAAGILYCFDAKKGGEYTVTSVAYIGFGAVLPPAAALAALPDYETLRRENACAYREAWDRSDVVLKGDEALQKALRYSIYHLLVLTPKTPASSIAARGLSGQTYKGAVFWDTEIFMLPFYLLTDSAAAKRIVEYRIATLEGAREKAAELGYAGAFYAWESQDGGREGCSFYNVVDVFTSRPVRTYFRDKQAHISGDVVYALAQYIEQTGDEAILMRGGLEMVLECAKFFISYAAYDCIKGEFRLRDVIGPDEYHERVSDNAFTSRMARFTVEQALRYIGADSPVDSGYIAAALEKTNLADKAECFESFLRTLKRPTVRDNVTEQFDGYFGLEDVALAEVKARLVHPNEYWGGTTGVAESTQIIKQADVIALQWLFKNEFCPEEKRANFDYYAPRTEHGSSLSACMYGLCACDVGNPDYAKPFFEKTATVDLSGESKQFAGKVYIGGTHPAANGGAYLMAVYGFAGLYFAEGEPRLRPRLPEGITEISFKVNYRGKAYALCARISD